MEKIVLLLAKELNIKPAQAEAALKLLDDGNTVPFIARYRKEMTVSLDEEQIRNVEARAQYLRNLDERREEILNSIREQEKLTPELEQQIAAAVKMQELEDLYLPYRPKKRTRAQIAREKGLEPLASYIVLQADTPKSLSELAAPFINAEKGVETESDAWKGAQDIVAETISDRADVRALIRRALWQNAQLSSVLTTDEATGKDFLMYKEYSEPVRQLPPHRTLALNRGEKLKYLKLTLDYPEEKMLAELRRFLKIKEGTALSALYAEACADAYKRLIFPSIEREIRNELTEKAEKQAINVFSVNLRQLLLQQPIAGHTVIGLDPGYRTGCKTAVIDPQGKALATDTLYIIGSQRQQDEAEAHFVKLVKEFGATLVTIGNGTASYETEEFTAKMIEKHKLNLSYLIVSEAGASVYSASPLAKEELPDLNVSLRGAVSIARRIQDPLAELVKIEPKAIGVGQYQHDVDQTKLKHSLDLTVESCVNNVGVNLNTASQHLLMYVSGLGPVLAKNIVDYRKDNGAFTSRAQLKKVPRLGPSAFQQCAGFLRIPGAKNPLDNSAVHPESYAIVEQMAKDQSCSVSDLISHKDKLEAIDIKRYVTDDIGIPTLTDIIKELEKPGRDPREQIEEFEFDSRVNTVDDLIEGMELPGIVTNITNFGAFVDIGVHQDGLVHISQMANRRIAHPTDVVKLHQHVRVRVIEVDRRRNRISLSFKL